MVTHQSGAREPQRLRLPQGMHDILPRAYAAKRALGTAVLGHLELAGYQAVQPPAFELAKVLERGLGTLPERDVLRFVEPASGEVAVLRPDVTPQIARMVATHYRDAPAPLRFAYQARVLRRRHERARKQSQISQAGVELLGVAGPKGDLELIELLTSTMEKVQVYDYVLDLGHAGIARDLLSAVEPHLREPLKEALAIKDPMAVRDVTADVRGSAPLVTALNELCLWQGGLEVLKAAAPLLAKTPAQGSFEAYAYLVKQVAKHERQKRILLDLGEVRGSSYYTGITFQLLAEGPGRPVASGGRYDELLARYGSPMPAAGFGIDLQHLAWARKEAGLDEPNQRGVVVVSERSGLLEQLRALGMRAVAADPESADSYAPAWGYQAVLWDEGAQFRLEVLDVGSQLCQRCEATHEVASWVMAQLNHPQES